MARRIDNALIGAGTVTAGVATAEVADADDNRNELTITNDSDTVIYLALGEAAVLNKGIRLNAAGGSWSTTGERVFQGAVNCICSVASKNLCVVEF